MHSPIPWPIESIEKQNVRKAFKVPLCSSHLYLDLIKYNNQAVASGRQSFENLPTSSGIPPSFNKALWAVSKVDLHLFLQQRFHLRDPGYSDWHLSCWTFLGRNSAHIIDHWSRVVSWNNCQIPTHSQLISLATLHSRQLIVQSTCRDVCLTSDAFGVIPRICPQTTGKSLDTGSHHWVQDLSQQFCMYRLCYLPGWCFGSSWFLTSPNRNNAKACQSYVYVSTLMNAKTSCSIQNRWPFQSTRLYKGQCHFPQGKLGGMFRCHPCLKPNPWQPGSRMPSN